MISQWLPEAYRTLYFNRADTIVAMSNGSGIVDDQLQSPGNVLERGWGPPQTIKLECLTKIVMFCTRRLDHSVNEFGTSYRVSL